MKPALISVFLILITLGTAAQTDIFQNDGIAIRGYDPVAYFTVGKAIKGQKEWSYQWGKATWLFSSPENLTAFKAAPEKYAPQFGGYCAYGASERHKSPTDPNAFTIVGGKLYLNYNAAVKLRWLPDTAARIPAAVAYWKSLEKK